MLQKGNGVRKGERLVIISGMLFGVSGAKNSKF